MVGVSEAARRPWAALCIAELAARAACEATLGDVQERTGLQEMLAGLASAAWAAASSPGELSRAAAGRSARREAAMSSTCRAACSV